MNAPARQNIEWIVNRGGDVKRFDLGVPAQSFERFDQDVWVALAHVMAAFKPLLGLTRIFDPPACDVDCARNPDLFIWPGRMQHVLEAQLVELDESMDSAAVKRVREAGYEVIDFLFADLAP